MSDDGDFCIYGDDGAAAFWPGTDAEAVHEHLCRYAALDAAERQVRTTYVLAANAPTPRPPTRIVVPSRLQRPALIR